MFYLYGTSHCHLCEEAESILKVIQSRLPITLMKFDIADDLKMMDLYGLKIPVLVNQNTNDELCWPFSITDIEEFIVINKVEN